MKQPEDNKTMELPLAKRGRGRPKLEHALSQAERAKRYRDNKRAQKNSDAQSVTQYAAAPGDVLIDKTDQVDDLREKVARLTAMLEDAEREVAALRKDQALLIQERTNAFKAYDDMHAQWEQATRDKCTITEQAAALSSLVHKLEEKVTRRDKTIKKLRDANERHA